MVLGFALVCSLMAAQLDFAEVAAAVLLVLDSVDHSLHRLGLYSTRLIHLGSLGRWSLTYCLHSVEQSQFQDFQHSVDWYRLHLVASPDPAECQLALAVVAKE